MLLPAVRTVLAVFGLAADELLEKLIALVVQLLMDADLRRVVPADRRLLGHHEKGLQRRVRRLLVAADALEDRVDLTGAELAERRPKPRRHFGIERRETTEPLQRQPAVALA